MSSHKATNHQSNGVRLLHDSQSSRFLSIGESQSSFSFVFDSSSLTYDYVSESVESVLGCRAESFTFAYFVSHLPQNEYLWLIAVEDRISSYFNEIGPESFGRIKTETDFLYTKEDGNTVRLLREMMLIEEADHRIKRIGVYTDISHIKPEGQNVLNIISKVDSESLYHVTIQPEQVQHSPFTPREREVIALLFNGRSAKEIAQELHISLDTVRNHKRHLFEKAKCNSTLQLLHSCIRQGWFSPHV